MALPLVPKRRSRDTSGAERPESVKARISVLVQSLRTFDVSTIERRDDWKANAFAALINSTLADIFGQNSTEYEEYSIRSFDALPPGGDVEYSLAEVQKGYREGIKAAAQKLRTLLESVYKKPESVEEAPAPAMPAETTEPTSLGNQKISLVTMRARMRKRHSPPVTGDTTALGDEGPVKADHEGAGSMPVAGIEFPEQGVADRETAEPEAKVSVKKVTPPEPDEPRSGEAAGTEHEIGRDAFGKTEEEHARYGSAPAGVAEKAQRREPLTIAGMDKGTSPDIQERAGRGKNADFRRNESLKGSVGDSFGDLLEEIAAAGDEPEGAPTDTDDPSFSGADTVTIVDAVDFGPADVQVAGVVFADPHDDVSLCFEPGGLVIPESFQQEPCAGQPHYESPVDNAPGRSLSLPEDTTAFLPEDDLPEANSAGASTEERHDTDISGSLDITGDEGRAPEIPDELGADTIPDDLVAPEATLSPTAGQTAEATVSEDEAEDAQKENLREEDEASLLAAAPPHGGADTEATAGMAVATPSDDEVVAAVQPVPQHDGRPLPFESDGFALPQFPYPELPVEPPDHELPGDDEPDKRVLFPADEAADVMEDELPVTTDARMPTEDVCETGGEESFDAARAGELGARMVDKRRLEAIVAHLILLRALALPNVDPFPEAIVPESPVGDMQKPALSPGTRRITAMLSAESPLEGSVALAFPALSPHHGAPAFPMLSLFHAILALPVLQAALSPAEAVPALPPRRVSAQSALMVSEAEKFRWQPPVARVIEAGPGDFETAIEAGECAISEPGPSAPLPEEVRAAGTLRIETVRQGLRLTRYQELLSAMAQEIICLKEERIGSGVEPETGADETAAVSPYPAARTISAEDALRDGRALANAGGVAYPPPEPEEREVPKEGPTKEAKDISPEPDRKSEEALQEAPPDVAGAVPGPSPDPPAVERNPFVVKTKERPVPKAAGAAEVQAQMKALMERIGELKSFDVATIKERYDTRAEELRTSVNNTLAGIFGINTQAYWHHSLPSFEASLAAGGGPKRSPQVLRGAYKAGIDKAIANLEAILESLKGKLNAPEQGAVSRSEAPARTAPAGQKSVKRQQRPATKPEPLPEIEKPAREEAVERPVRRKAVKVPTVERNPFVVKTKERPVPKAAGAAEVQAQMKALMERIGELKSFDVATIKERYDTRAEELRTSVNNTLAGIFGINTQAYWHHSLPSFEASLAAGGGPKRSPQVLRGAYKAGIDKAIANLEAILESLKGKIEQSGSDGPG